jgi:hypothetical protein
MYRYGILFMLMMMIWPVSAPASQQGEHPRLHIVNRGTAEALLYYGDRPALAFGHSHQRTLSQLGPGSPMDIQEWVQWAAQFKMTNLRSYPPSRIASDGSLDLFKRASSGRFDLTQFNPEYFLELRRVCELLREHGIIVHLQLWQAVAWKKSWDILYYNPKNNVNPDISRNAGPGEFVTTRNPVLLSHQKEYVRQVLDATGDLGNVFYDIMNEIGNGVGTSERWVEEIIDTVRKWERDNGLEVLLTLNDEGGMRMGEFSLRNPRLDLLIKDLGRYDEHVQARAKYRKPTIGVRNIDYNSATGQRTYFFAERDLDRTSNASFQSRGRRCWWRMFMALVQSNGAYSDVTHEMRKRDLQAEHSVLYFKNFIASLQDYGQLRISPQAIASAPGAVSYCLQSTREVVVYCEAPNGRAGLDFPAGVLRLKELMLQDGEHTAVVYDPATGASREEAVVVSQGRLEMQLPGFTDDIAVHIVNSQVQIPSDPPVEAPRDETPREPAPGNGGSGDDDLPREPGGEPHTPGAGPGGSTGGGCTMSPGGPIGLELLLTAALLPFMFMVRRLGRLNRADSRS